MTIYKYYTVSKGWRKLHEGFIAMIETDGIIKASHKRPEILAYYLYRNGCTVYDVLAHDRVKWTGKNGKDYTTVFCSNTLRKTLKGYMI